MINTELDGVPQLRKAAARIPAAVDKAAAAALAGYGASEVGRVKAAANSASKVARLAARGVRSVKAAGGSRIVAGGPGQAAPGASFGDLFFGAEFGGGSRPATRQFEPYRPKGYWFFPTIEGDEPRLIAAGQEALDAAEEVWHG